MDVCYRIIRAVKTTEKWFVKAYIYNMGYTSSWCIDTIVMSIELDDVVHWKMAWEPKKCMRKAVWINMK